MPHKYYIVLMPSWTEIHPGIRSLFIGQQWLCWPLIGCMCHSHSTDHPHGAFLTVLHRLYITLGPTRRMGRFHSGCTRSGDLWATPWLNWIRNPGPSKLGIWITAGSKFAAALRCWLGGLRSRRSSAKLEIGFSWKKLVGGYGMKILRLSKLPRQDGIRNITKKFDIVADDCNLPFDVSWMLKVINFTQDV